MSGRALLPLVFCVLFPQASTAGEPLKYVFTHYPPANYQTETGEYKGFFVDIVMEALAERMAIPVAISIFPWKRCQKLLEEGDADMITTIPTPERSMYTVTHAKPIWIKKWRVHTYVGHPHINEFHKVVKIDDLRDRPYTVISYIGNGWSKSMIEDVGISVFNATTVEGMYRMLAAKRGDMIIEDDILVAPALRQLGLTHQIVATEGIVAESNFHMLIGKKSRFSGIIPELNHVIEEMWKDGTMARIFARYQ